MTQIQAKTVQPDIKRLVQKLQNAAPKRPSVVVMPDFFLDRIVTYPKDLHSFINDMARIAEQKGGNIDGVPQKEIRGGNAVNTASALAKLGVKVHPIICTDKFGYALIKLFLEGLDVDLSHVKIRECLSITTAIELHAEEGKVNVMLRDLGSLADFSPKDLSPEDFRLIEEADYVCIFNWAGTRRFGTQLAEEIFKRVKTKGRGKTYLDTADPSSNKAEIPQLVEKVMLKHFVDILSVNENEAIWYASYFEPEKVAKHKKRLKTEALAKECAQILAEHLDTRIDLHTTRFSMSIFENRSLVVPAFDVEVKQATGAGDAWNAGNIYADSQGFKAEARLTFANAVAAYYVSSLEAAHPTLAELRGFLLSKSSKTFSKIW
ncbi:hypothetical protein DRO34_01945 [Candidatus Bathyarchaeota archaeon]|nr:MAG: hypothetical protein DRO34_01945 [Candidatus Bathyarchaeota archaeon]